MRSSTMITDRAAQAAKAGDWLNDTSVPGLALRVTPGGVKTFVYRYRINGRQHLIKIGRYGDSPGQWSVKAARAKAKVWAGRVEEGQDPAGRRDAKTLSDLATFYLEEYAPAAGLKERTISDARAVLQPMLVWAGGRRVHGITPKDIRRAHSEARQRKPRPVSEKTLRKRAKAGVPDVPLAPTICQANRLLTALSKMFALAVEEEWCETNPCRGVNKYKVSRRIRYLEEEEVGRLLAACDAYPNQSAANAIRLLLFTGARLNEVLKADWKQFNLEGRVWQKPSAHTKTKIVHRVHLDGPVLDLLRAMREADPQGRFLFPAERPRRDGQETPRSDLKRPWKAICKAARITDARRHDLRRTTAALMASDGADRQTIGRVLGHTQASTTDSYVNIFHTAQSAALKRTGNRIDALRAAHRSADVSSLEEARKARAVVSEAVAS